MRTDLLIGPFRLNYCFSKVFHWGARFEFLVDETGEYVRRTSLGRFDSRIRVFRSESMERSAARRWRFFRFFEAVRAPRSELSIRRGSGDAGCFSCSSVYFLFALVITFCLCMAATIAHCAPTPAVIFGGVYKEPSAGRAGALTNVMHLL